MKLAGRLASTALSLVIAAYALIATNSAVAALDNEKERANGQSSGNGMYSTYSERQKPGIDGDLGEAYPIAMDDLLPALLQAIHYISKYRLPDKLPAVHKVPHETIEQLACGKPCAALAAYRSGEGIYLDEALNPETNLFARSVLLHELVHYVQDVSNELAENRPCERWYRREQEAYAIQKRFLILLGSPMRVAYAAGTTCLDQSG